MLFSTMKKTKAKNAEPKEAVEDTGMTLPIESDEVTSAVDAADKQMSGTAEANGGA